MRLAMIFCPRVAFGRRLIACRRVGVRRLLGARRFRPDEKEAREKGREQRRGPEADKSCEINAERSAHEHPLPGRAIPGKTRVGAIDGGR